MDNSVSGWPIKGQVVAEMEVNWVTDIGDG